MQPRVSFDPPHHLNGVTTASPWAWSVSFPLAAAVIALACSTVWDAHIHGPKDTPYEGGYFELLVNFPDGQCKAAICFHQCSSGRCCWAPGKGELDFIHPLHNWDAPLILSTSCRRSIRRHFSRCRLPPVLCHCFFALLPSGSSPLPRLAEYPHKAPQMKFVTRCYHPNIDGAGGICINILKDEWSPAFTVLAVLRSLSALLAAPNPGELRVLPCARLHALGGSA